MAKFLKGITWNFSNSFHGQDILPTTNVPSSYRMEMKTWTINKNRYIDNNRNSKRILTRLSERFPIGSPMEPSIYL